MELRIVAPEDGSILVFSHFSFFEFVVVVVIVAVLLT